MGSNASDFVGNKVVALTNGNYVVVSINWNSTAGAVTLGNGSTGTSGIVSDQNSLVGSRSWDLVGSHSITALSNGNYVVSSPHWDNDELQDVGTVTFGNGTNGITGIVSETNSLVGTSATEAGGDFRVTALPNGNYVVSSLSWDNGDIANVGAVVLSSGTNGITGMISPTNSFIGSSAEDRVGLVSALPNSNYIISSPSWDNGETENVGAVTFSNGTKGITGEISPQNSLVGSTEGDLVGFGSGDWDMVTGSIATILTNGNYVISSPKWNNGSATNAGAMTLVDGRTGMTGEVSPANSLVGSRSGDEVGRIVRPLGNGEFVVATSIYDNGEIVDAGAVSYLKGIPSSFASSDDAQKDSSRFNREQKSNLGNFGLINLFNSVIGTTANGGTSMQFSFDSRNKQLVVSRPDDTIVTLFSLKVTLSDSVNSSSGRGIPRAFVSMTDSSGEIRTARTSQFGKFKFEDVKIGQSYTIAAHAKGYRFESRVLEVNESINNLNITAE